MPSDQSAEYHIEKNLWGKKKNEKKLKDCFKIESLKN